ncbi:MAG: secondary thiamine-phosphate synthase enzyme YjbQ [Planctomycetota bacterium]|nr:secondary thiamine-phosphate synthase enzyme YjbQ [Planctomycetota bacterium]
MQTLQIKTTQKVELIEITDKVSSVVSQSDIKEGFCHLFVPHTTAGILINENADPSVRQDIEDALSRLVPASAKYTHSEGNSPAHIKSSIVGCQTTIPIRDSHLELGTWQGIFFCEFDGPRTRQVWVSLLKLR